MVICRRKKFRVNTEEKGEAGGVERAQLQVVEVLVQERLLRGMLDGHDENHLARSVTRVMRVLRELLVQTQTASNAI